MSHLNHLEAPLLLYKGGYIEWQWKMTTAVWVLNRCYIIMWWIIIKKKCLDDVINTAADRWRWRPSLSYSCMPGRRWRLRLVWRNETGRLTADCLPGEPTLSAASGVSAERSCRCYWAMRWTRWHCQPQITRLTRVRANLITQLITRLSGSTAARRADWC